MVESFVPCSLPDTQTQTEVDWSQSKDEVWGWLYPIRVNFKTFPLVGVEFSIGRNPKCDVVLSPKNMNPNTLKIISKLQFKIVRSVGIGIAHLHDCSYNGTYVNGAKVGKGQDIIITDDDEISVGHPDLKIFVFKTRSDASDVPREISSKYVVSRTLGVGAGGRVKLVIDKRTYERFAMKTIAKTSRVSFAKEAEILAALRHPCVVRMEEIVDADDATYVFLELMEGGELYDRIVDRRRLPEPQAKLFFYQMARAVEYLHGVGVAHRDLKPENVLLASDDEITLVKVTDFGLSKLGYDGYLKTVCGTPMYVAPEVLLTAGRGAYTNKIDVWSLGVILYFALSGALPFDKDRPDFSLADQIVCGAYDFDGFERVSSTAIDLIGRMLVVEPDDRASIDEVLEHEWLRDESMRSVALALMYPAGRDSERTDDGEVAFAAPPKRSKTESC